MSATAADQIVIAVEPGAGHAFPGHPESPARFRHFDDLILAPFGGQLSPVEAEPATLEAILRVHTKSHIDRIEAALSDAPTYLDYGDTYVTSQSWKMALRSAGGVLAVLQAILDGQAATGFAFTRPPGHHATPERAMGFCLLNNIAIAARAAQAAGAARIAIIDFDVHHGNGTQAVFDSDPDVLYISTHQAGIYPGTGAVDEIGTGDGRGSTINIPLPALAGDQALESAARRVISPALARHRPDLVLVSAGFDAHWRDPLANLQVTAGGFHAISQTLCDLARAHAGAGPLLCLEGGYDPLALAHSAANTLLALLGRPAQPEPWANPPAQEPDIGPLLDAVVQLHAL